MFYYYYREEEVADEQEPEGEDLNSEDVCHKCLCVEFMNSIS